MGLRVLKVSSIFAAVGGSSVFGALLWAQTIEIQFPGVGQVWHVPGPTCTGWPLIHWSKWTSVVLGEMFRSGEAWIYRPLAINAAVVLILSWGTWVALLLLTRRIGWPPRFNLSDLLVAALVVALTIVIWQRFPQIVSLLAGKYSNYLSEEWYREPRWLTIAWVFAMACTIYALLIAGWDSFTLLLRSLW